MNNNTYLFFALLLFLLASGPGAGSVFSQVTDKDGKTYGTVTIGGQEWMSENLGVSHYRNGDEIPQIRNQKEWNNLSSGAWCWYENASDNGTVYGKLYNWYAVNDPRGIAPEGWHVASDQEWITMTDVLGGRFGKNVGGQLKSTDLWSMPNTGAENSAGFNALPAGYRMTTGFFERLRSSCYFWTSTEQNVISAWYWYLGFADSDIKRDHNHKNLGHSVRCVKD